MFYFDEDNNITLHDHNIFRNISLEEGSIIYILLNCVRNFRNGFLK